MITIFLSNMQTKTSFLNINTRLFSCICCILHCKFSATVWATENMNN